MMDQNQLLTATDGLFAKIGALKRTLDENEDDILAGMLDGIRRQLPYQNAEGFGEKLAGFAEGLTEAERSTFRTLISMACGDLVLRQSSSARARAGLVAAARFFEHSGSTGVLWRGVPDFTTGPTIEDLRREASQQRASAARERRAFAAFGASLAREFVTTPHFASLLKEHGLGIEPSGETCYLYYEREGDGVSLHLDKDTYAVNGLLMLEHESEASSSRLLILNAKGEFEKISLGLGELILFRAGNTVHGREDLGPRERVVLLSMGFVTSPEC